MWKIASEVRKDCDCKGCAFLARRNPESRVDTYLRTLTERHWPYGALQTRAGPGSSNVFTMAWAALNR